MRMQPDKGVPVNKFFVVWLLILSIILVVCKRICSYGQIQMYLYTSFLVQYGFIWWCWSHDLIFEHLTQLVPMNFVSWLMKPANWDDLILWGFTGKRDNPLMNTIIQFILTFCVEICLPWKHSSISFFLKRPYHMYLCFLSFPLFCQGSFPAFRTIFLQVYNNQSYLPHLKVLPLMSIVLFAVQVLLVA